MKKVLFFTLFLCCITPVIRCNNIISTGGVKKKMAFSVNYDTLGGKATIQLKVNEILTDSIVLEDLDFEINLLEQLNDTLWKYTYSFGADKSHSMYLSRQFLLQEWDNKIHLLLISCYRFDMVNDENFVVNENFILDLSNTLNPNIKMNSYHKRFVADEFSIDSSSTIVYLNYNIEKQIFYSSIDTLNGIYEVLPKEPKKRKAESGEDIVITNEVVYTLKIERSHFIYYKNNWFIAKDFPYHTLLIPFFPMEN